MNDDWRKEADIAKVLKETYELGFKDGEISAHKEHYFMDMLRNKTKEIKEIVWGVDNG